MKHKCELKIAPIWEVVRDSAGNFYCKGCGDKIEVRIGQRGGIAAEVRMGGELKTNEAVDELIERIDYAIKKLKEKYPEIKIKGKEDERS